MVSAGKYFVTGEFRVADDSKGVSFPGAHVEVVLACDYEALVRRCRELEGDRDRLILELRLVRMQRDVRAEACLAAIKERENASDAAINKSP